jgi:hypothetical protein
VSFVEQQGGIPTPDKINGLFCGLAGPPGRHIAKYPEASMAALSTEILVVWGRYISVGAP